MNYAVYQKSRSVCCCCCCNWKRCCCCFCCRCYFLFTLLPDVNNSDIRMILSIRKTAKKSVQDALIIKNHNYEYSLLLFLLVGIQLSQMVKTDLQKCFAKMATVIRKPCTECIAELDQLNLVWVLVLS